MIIEIPKQNRTANVELISRDGSVYTMKVDDKIYEIDMVEVSPGIYSLITNGRSFNVETIAIDGQNKYVVNTFVQTFELEIVDAQVRYRRSRNRNSGDDSGSQIKVPMPGKVVDVLVSEGDEVKSGQTLVIVSAMKMDSEYKTGREGIVKKILVKPGDTVDSDQVLIVLE